MNKQERVKQVLKEAFLSVDDLKKYEDPEYTYRKFTDTTETETLPGHKLQTAVGVVLSNGKVLLGKCKINDDRFGKLCFVGGGIDEGESLLQAAKRETYEEAGIFTKAIMTNPIVIKSKPTVGFVLLQHIHGELKPNHEFEYVQWYDINNIPKEEMYDKNFEVLTKFLS